MDIYEEAVMNCLVANGETFVAPQFDIGKGWSCPDFVAIRPSKKKVYVVEVTAAGSASDLVDRVRTRENRWLSQLRDHLELLGVAGRDWAYSVLVFVRRDQCDWFKARVEGEAGVTVRCLEEALAHWEWNPSVWTSDFSFETDALGRAAR